MQKFTTYIILLAFVVVGFVSLYRAIMSIKDMNSFSAKVLEKRIETITIRKGHSKFGITLKVDYSDTKLGIYSGTDIQTVDTALFNRLDTGKVYLFFVDPTVSISSNVNLGLREIRFNNSVIYKEHRFFHWILGISFLLMGGGGIFIITKYKRKIQTSK